MYGSKSRGVLHPILDIIHVITFLFALLINTCMSEGRFPDVIEIWTVPMFKKGRDMMSPSLSLAARKQLNDQRLSLRPNSLSKFVKLVSSSMSLRLSNACPHDQC